MEGVRTKRKLDFVLGIADEPKKVFTGKAKTWIEQQFDEAGDEVVFGVAVHFNMYEAQEKRWRSIADRHREFMASDPQRFSDLNAEEISADPVLKDLFLGAMGSMKDCGVNDIKVWHGIIGALISKEAIFSLAKKDNVARIQIHQIPGRRNPLDDIAMGMIHARWADALGMKPDQAM